MTLINDTGLGLAQRMRAARVMADLDQAQMAARIGVARQTVSNWERGVAEPSATYFVRWANETRQPLEWLAEGVKCATRDSNPQPSDLYLAPLTLGVALLAMMRRAVTL